MAGIRDLDQLLLDGNGFPGCQRCKYFQTGSAALCYRCASKEWQRLAGDGDRCQICDLPFNAGEQECRNPVCKMSDRWFEWNYAIAMRSGRVMRIVGDSKPAEADAAPRGSGEDRHPGGRGEGKAVAPARERQHDLAPAERLQCLEAGDIEQRFLFVGDDGAIRMIFDLRDAGSRALYLRDERSGRSWSVGWQPVKARPESYECVHGVGYSLITSRTEGIQAQWLIFVPFEEPLELWRVRA